MKINKKYRGKIMTLIIDPQTGGIAGNMIIGALVDLGANPKELKEIMESVKHVVNICFLWTVMIIFLHIIYQKSWRFSRSRKIKSR